MVSESQSMSKYLQLEITFASIWKVTLKEKITLKSSRRLQLDIKCD